MRISVNVKMTYPTSGRDNGPRMATLSVRDKSSGIQFLEVQITPDALRDMLASCEGFTDCQAEVCGLQHLGKTHTHERFTFPTRSGDYQATKTGIPAWLKKEVAALEVDGWECDTPSRNNQAQWVVIRRKYT